MSLCESSTYKLKFPQLSDCTDIADSMDRAYGGGEGPWGKLTAPSFGLNRVYAILPSEPNASTSLGLGHSCVVGVRHGFESMGPRSE